VYLAPDLKHPYGRCISTGGYHNAMATPALDDLSGIWADLCLLCDRHSAKLLNGRVSQMPDLLLIGRQPGESDGRGNIGYVPMAAAGYIEMAKSAAQRTFIPAAIRLNQDDVATPTFLAWSKEQRTGRCLDACLAMLAVVGVPGALCHGSTGAAGAARVPEPGPKPCAASGRGTASWDPNSTISPTPSPPQVFSAESDIHADVTLDAGLERPPHKFAGRVAK